MFKHFFFLILLLGFSLATKSTFAQQQKIDSLELLLKAARTDAEKLKLYILLAEQFQDHHPSERAIQKIIEGIELAKRNSDDFALARLLRFRGQIYIDLHPFDYEQAINYFKDALSLHKQLQYQYPEPIVLGKERSRAYNNVAYMYWQWGKLYESLHYYDSAIAESSKIWELDSVDTQFARLKGMQHNSKGAVLWGLGNYSDAITQYIQSIKYFENSNSKNLISLATANIGLVYDSWGQKEEALIFFRRALVLGIESGNLSATAYALSNLGRFMETAGQYDSALIYYEKSTEKYFEDNSYGGIGLNLNRLGNVYLKKAENDKALEVFLNALSIAEQFETQYWMAIARQNISKAYVSKGDLDKALLYAQSSNVIAKREGYKEILKDNSLNISKIYERLNDYRNALGYYQKYTELKDSLFTQENFREITLIKEQFESVRRENENQILRKDKLLQEQQLARNRLEKVSLFVITIVLLLSAIYFIYANRRITRINKELIETSEEVMRQKQSVSAQAIELKKSNEIKNLMFSIVSHDLRGPIARVGQMVNILNSSILSPENFKSTLPLMASNIRDIINLTDNLLYWARSQMEGLNVSKVSFDIYELLKDRLPLLEKAAAEKGVDLRNEIQPGCKVYADPYMVELVIRNLLNNAIKFSTQGGQIVLKASVSDQTATISVRDNGMGIPPEELHRIFDDIKYTTPGTSNERGVGLGLKVSKQFVELNGGKIWVESIYRDGSAFFFTLPVS